MTEEKELTARAQLRQWVMQQVNGKAQLEIPELCDEAVDHFSKDRPFVRTFLNEAMRPMVYQVVQQVVSASREYVVLGDEVVSQAVVRARSKPLLGRFTKWMEHAGDRHYRFMDLTREQVVLAIEERKKRVSGELTVIALEEHVMTKLQPGERVRDRFTAEGLEQLMNEYAEKLGEFGGNLRNGLILEVSGDVETARPLDGGNPEGPEGNRGLATVKGRGNGRRRGKADDVPDSLGNGSAGERGDDPRPDDRSLGEGGDRKAEQRVQAG
jgi:hypothetical protein